MRLYILAFTAPLAAMSFMAQAQTAITQAASEEQAAATTAQRPNTQEDAPAEQSETEASEGAEDSAGPVTRDQIQVGEVIHGSGGAAIAPITDLQDGGAVISLNGRPALLPYSGIARRDGKLSIGLTRAQLVAAARARQARR